MRKSGLLVLVLMLGLIWGCAQQAPVVKIGFSGPLTGDGANYGKLMTQAITIAVDEKNATGGIGGKIKVRLIAEDDEGKVEKANTVIEKLAGVDKVYGLIGAVFSSCSLAIAPKAQQAKIVMISPSSTHKDLTQVGSYIFRDVLSDQIQAQVFAKYAAQKLQLKKIAILHLKNDYSQGLADDFVKQFTADGGQIVAMESAIQGDKDFKTQLTKIKATNPDALYLPDYVAEIAQILEQAKQLGLNIKILSADGFSNPDIFNLAGDLANGVIFSNSPDESVSGNAVRAQFESNYEKKWGEKPDSFSLNAYDAANIILAAIEKTYATASDADKDSLNLNRDQIRDNVATTVQYPGVSGLITFLPNGDAIKNVGIFVATNKTYQQTGIYKMENNQLLDISSSSPATK